MSKGMELTLLRDIQRLGVSKGMEHTPPREKMIKKMELEVILKRKKGTKVMTLILRGEKVTMGMKRILSRKTEGMELNLKREKVTKGLELILTKEKVTKRTKLILKFPSIKLGHLSLKMLIISGVQGSYTGVVLTRHHSSILCILLN